MIADFRIARPKPGDVVVLLLCLLLIPVSIMPRNGDQTTATAIRITSRGQTNTYPLTPDRLLEIEGSIGVSVIELQGGRARFVSSPCSGKLCVLSGWHSHSGDGMACLPNRVAMNLIAEQEDFDGMNF